MDASRPASAVPADQSPPPNPIGLVQSVREDCVLALEQLNMAHTGVCRDCWTVDYRDVNNRLANVVAHCNKAMDDIERLFGFDDDDDGVDTPLVPGEPTARPSPFSKFPLVPGEGR